MGMEPIQKLAISFSGGRSSAVMTKLLWDKYKDSDWDVRITFANTGCEHEATLDFVHECELRFGWPIVWVEAEVSPHRGMGVRHRVVSYETASRKGEPFEAVVSKYGIFNPTTPACTARLKTDPMKSYLRSIGYKFRGEFGDGHMTAIGIRADEMDRVSEKRHELGIVYPLVDAGLRKRDIAIAIKSWGFDLKIPNDAYGNCVWCWKKTLRKHLTIAKEAPVFFDFPKRMEEQYGHVNGDTAAAFNGRRYWFRKHLKVDDILRMSKEQDFVPYTDSAHDHAFDVDLDVGGSCGDSCEIMSDETTEGNNG